MKLILELKSKMNNDYEYVFFHIPKKKYNQSILAVGEQYMVDIQEIKI